MIEWIDLNHFRCFEKMTLHFKPGVNLLIGDNASGKTTIIRALGVVLNSFFNKFSDENTKFYGLSKYDFTEELNQTSIVNEKPITIGFKYMSAESQLVLESKKGRTLQKPLSAISAISGHKYRNLFDDFKNQALDLPLIASFSTGDIHKARKVSIEPFKKYLHKPSFGYYESLQGDGFLPYWTKRLLVLAEGKHGPLEINGVTKALGDALGPQGCNIFNNIQIRFNAGVITFKMKDGRMTTFENLSDGYRRLVNIVIDLAFRCMILNQGIFGENACKKTIGTVLIDEIDLHLHPTLQSSVIKGLTNAFPKVQFIIASHAPMIMGSVENTGNNKIIYLNYDKEKGYNAIDRNLYGLDASTIIEAGLGIIPRPKEVDDLLSNLYNSIDNAEYEKARSLLQELRTRFGNMMPELSEAEGMLSVLDVSSYDQD